MRRILFATALLSALTACGPIVGGLAETAINRIILTEGQTDVLLASCDDCKERFEDHFVVDMHADSFLWGRNPLMPSTVGHVDIHRLRRGGIDLQIFSVPSRTPLGVTPFDGGKKDDDARFYDGETEYRPLGDLRCTKPKKNVNGAGFLYVAGLRGGKDPEEIAFDQARQFCDVTGGDWDYEKRLCEYLPSRIPTAEHFFAIRSAKDLVLLEDAIARAKGPKPVGALLSIEGVHWIPKDAPKAFVREKIADLKRAGFVMIGLTHKFNNGLGGSDEDCEKAEPLTAAGAEAVRAVFDEGLILDVAHLAKDALWPEKDGRTTALSIAAEPQYKGLRRIAMSHGAVRTEQCWNYRNLPKEHAIELMSRRAPFGVIHWDRAFCLKTGAFPTPGQRVRTFRDVDRAIIDTYDDLAKSLGSTDAEITRATEALAIGADLDGAMVSPYGVLGYPHLLWRLSNRPWCRQLGAKGCDAAVRRIAGGNMVDFLKEALPPE